MAVLLVRGYPRPITVKMCGENSFITPFYLDLKTTKYQIVLDFGEPLPIKVEKGDTFNDTMLIYQFNYTDCHCNKKHHREHVN